MTNFRFRLERVLDWRRTQLDLEESRLKQLQAAVAALDQRRAELEAHGWDARSRMVARPCVEAFDLHLLDAYRASLELECRRLAEKRRQAEAEIQQQQRRLLDARRRCRLLENLRERRRAEWRYESERAAETGLAPRRRFPESTQKAGHPNGP